LAVRSNLHRAPVVMELRHPALRREGCQSRQAPLHVWAADRLQSWCVARERHPGSRRCLPSSVRNAASHSGATLRAGAEGRHDWQTDFAASSNAGDPRRCRGRQRRAHGLSLEASLLAMPVRETSVASHGVPPIGSIRCRARSVARPDCGSLRPRARLGRAARFRGSPTGAARPRA
jgi:hypothetical protein